MLNLATYSIILKVWCDQFSACNILTGGNIDAINGEKNHEINEAISDKCSKSAAEMSPSDLNTCTMICDPAMCCFYDDPGCTRDIDCGYYSFCKKLMTSELPGIGGLQPGDESIDEILPPSGGQHSKPPNPSDVKEACDNSIQTRSSTTFPFMEKSCAGLCQNYLCCFEEDYDPASCHEESTCNKYTPCKKLVEKKEKHFTECSVENLLTRGGLAECEQRCSNHLCCFNGSGCQGAIDHTCSEYNDCEILTHGFIIGSDLHGVTLFDYHKACSEDMANIMGGDLCSSVCEAVS